ncbi:MAG: GtrA family protein [Lachnospiraceae bacterium]|nr:GtrA family protein [Lachnospiraceae bacterium]
MKKLFDEILHFGIIGVLNTILGYVLMTVFYNVFHMGYWQSSAVSYTIGSIFSYFANKKHTFHVEGGNGKHALKFALHILVCYLLAYGLAKPMVKAVLSGYNKEIVENIALVVGMGMFIVFNFIGQKFFVFKGAGKEGK